MAAPTSEKVWTSDDSVAPPEAGSGDAPQDAVARMLTNPDGDYLERASRQESVENLDDIKAKANRRLPLPRTGSAWTGTTASSVGDAPDVEGDDLKKERRRPWSHKINPFKSKHPPPIPEERDISHEYGAGWFSKFTFHWMTPIMDVGYQRPLEEKDIWGVNPDRSSDLLAEKLMSAFKKRSEAKHKNPLRMALYDTVRREFWTGAICQFIASSLQILSPFTLRFLITFAQDAYIAQRTGGPAPDIGRGVGLVIGITLMQFVQSMSTNHFLYRGMMMGGELRAALIVAIFDKSMKISGRARAGGKALEKRPPPDVKPGSDEEKGWFEKHLPFTSNKRKDVVVAAKAGVSGDGQGWSNGRIVNLMSTDTYRVDQASGWFHMIWSAPYIIVLTLILLLINLSYSSLAGFGLLLVAFPILGRIVKSLFRQRERINKITDQRVSLTQEILSGVRFVKYFGWETSFLKRLAEIRRSEITKVRIVLSIRNAIMAVGMSMPIFAAMLAFITYSFTDNRLEPSRVFSSLALFNSLRLPLNFLPLVIGQVVDASASIKRIQEFLESEEAEDAADWDHDAHDAIQLQNASFTWERTQTRDADEEGGHASEKDRKQLPNIEARARKLAEKKARQLDKDFSDQTSSSESDTASEEGREEGKPFDISDINLSVGRKELIAIIGGVGSGKSSLLGALAGDMRRTSGNVVLGASRAFCPQYAWIQNTTVKENIIFGKEFNRKWYNEVVEACALRPDLEMLPNGDLTEIGERGITVSGGQKQRLNIARAIYFDADIVLMDDPLSAVDAHVGRHIMDEAICGLLKDKCRVLATHQLHVLHRCDRIVWMDAGHIKTIDTYDNLMANDREFQYLMATTAREGRKTGGEDDDEQDEPEKKKKRSKKGKALMQVEDRAVDSVKLDIYKAYIKSSGTWLSAPIVLTLLVLAQGANIVTSLWLSWWTSDKWGWTEGQYIGVYAGFGVLQAVLLFAFSVALTVFGTNASKVMLHQAVTRVLRAPMSFFDTTPLGRITNRFSKDVDTMDNTLTDAFRMFFLTAAAIISVFILIIVYFYYFAIALGPLLLLFLFSSSYYRASAREIKRHEAVMRSTVFSRFSEAVTGVATIRAYGLERQFSDSVREATDIMDGAYFLTFSNQRWLSMRLDVIGAFLVFTTGILVVTSRFNVNPSIGGLVLSYILQIVQMIQFVVRQLAEVENNMNSAERIHYYGTELDEEAPLHTIPVRELWPEKGEIVFDNVQMRYRPGLPLVLQGLDLHVKAGERVGVVGRTGAGKSTIMSTLFRLTELSGGKITIDGIDIATIGLADLRSRLSIIPQDPTLFRGTVRSNIDPFSQHTDLELWSALRQADLVGADQKMDDRSQAARIHLDAPVEEEGLNFSLGQRQLMALARALVRNSRIIVCDEATSSVDFETDRRIQRTIQTGFKGRTLLCIAHRLKTIVGYDRIVVMDQGRIAECDTPRRLWDRKGVFYGMCVRSGISEADFEKGEEELLEEELLGEGLLEEELLEEELLEEKERSDAVPEKVEARDEVHMTTKGRD